MSFSFSSVRTSEASLRASRSFSAASRAEVLSPSIASISLAMSRLSRAARLAGFSAPSLSSAAGLCFFAGVRGFQPAPLASRMSFCFVIPAFAAVRSSGAAASS